MGGKRFLRWPSLVPVMLFRMARASVSIFGPLTLQANQIVFTFWNHVMRIEGFRTPMEPAARTAGEELSGLLGQSAHYFAYFSISRTFLCDLMDLGTD